MIRRFEKYIEHVEQYGVKGETAVEECVMYLRDAISEFEDLREYEDTGLSADRVAELAKAEAEGRLLVLPCKQGDTLYVIGTKRLGESEKIVEEHRLSVTYDIDFNTLKPRERFFLTRELAEEAKHADK